MAQLIQNQQTNKPQTSGQPNAAPTPPTSITEQAQDKQLGSANTPKGAALAGGSTQQVAMAGTPAQQSNARKLEEDKSRQSLTKTEATATAAPATDPQKAAADRMDRIESLGATKGRIEALVQQSMQQVTAQPTPNLQVARDALAGVADPAARTQAQQALEAYSLAPTEENLKAVYDVMGRAGVDAGISRMFQPQAETLASAAQNALPSGPVTLGSLDLTQAGVDLNELSSALGVTPEELSAMDLDTLQGRIDSVQAQSYQTVAQMQARLADPSISPQERQAVIAQLKQAGAAAITGVEKEVDKLQADINSSRLVNLAGSDYTIEELLGDDGISSLIKQATTDPRKLAELMKDQKTAQLGKWIGDNKAALAALSESFDSDAADFLKVQDDLGQIGQSLGAGNEDLLKIITGADLPKSVLSGDLSALQEKLASSGAYQYLLKNPRLAQEFKEDPATLQALVDGEFSADEIKEAVRVRDVMKADPLRAKLLGSDGKIPTTKEELEALQEEMEAYDKLDPRLLQNAAPWVDSGDLTLSDIEAISMSKDPNAVFQDLQRWKQATQNFASAIKGVDPKDQAMKALFGTSDFSARDLASIMKSADPQAKQQLLSLFDTNGDGSISDDEMRGAESLQKVKAALGVGEGAASIIGQDGQYMGETLGKLLSSLGVDKDSYEKGVRTSLDQTFNRRLTEMADVEKQQTADFQNAQLKLEQARQALTSSPAVTQASTSMRNAFSQVGSGLGLHNFPTDPSLMSVQELQQMMAEASKRFTDRYINDPGAAGKVALGLKDYNKGAAQAQLDSIRAMLNSKLEAERGIASLQQNANRIAQSLKDTAAARQRMKDLGYNLAGMNEEQLAQMASQFGII